MKTLALLPAYNEAATLAGVVSEIRASCPGLDILVVDDASSDGSGDLLAGLGVQWLQLSQHLGLGCAVRVGLRYARLLGYDVVVRLDADGQHPANEIESLLGPLARAEVDAVVGSRFLGGQGSGSSAPKRLAQRCMGALLGRLTGTAVTDPTSGFWAFGPLAVRLLGDHHPRGYSEPELHLFLHRNGLEVIEVPVAMRARRGGRSTLTASRIILALARAALVVVVVPLRAAIRGGRRD